jgi:predicted DNA-binding transcriptional regulator AlpA
MDEDPGAERPTPTSDRLLDDMAVSLLTTMPRDVIVSLEHHGRFPRAVVLTSGNVCWRQSDVQAWIASLPKIGEHA